MTTNKDEQKDRSLTILDRTFIEHWLAKCTNTISTPSDEMARRNNETTLANRFFNGAPSAVHTTHLALHYQLLSRPEKSVVALDRAIVDDLHYKLRKLKPSPRMVRAAEDRINTCRLACINRQISLSAT
jgi:hypothetical protein